jgi:hypothetical protein
MNKPPHNLIKDVYDSFSAEERALDALSNWLGENFSVRLASTFQHRAEALRGSYRTAVYEIINLAREAEDIKAYYKKSGATYE